jgi:hypothetical protein
MSIDFQQVDTLRTQIFNYATSLRSNVVNDPVMDAVYLTELNKLVLDMTKEVCLQRDKLRDRVPTEEGQRMRIGDDYIVNLGRDSYGRWTYNDYGEDDYVGTYNTITEAIVGKK